MKHILLLSCLIFATAAFAQTAHAQKNKSKKETITCYDGPKDLSIKYAQTDENGKPIFTYVDKMPKPGYDLKKYLKENIHYPDSARAHHIEGWVIVRFVVGEDGRISDVTVIRSLGSGCDEEAVRVIKKMPKWSPGENGGKKVSVYYTMPIAFKLD